MEILLIQENNTNKSNKYLYNNNKKEDMKIKKQNTNIPNNIYNLDKIQN